MEHCARCGATLETRDGEADKAAAAPQELTRPAPSPEHVHGPEQNGDETPRFPSRVIARCDGKMVVIALESVRWIQSAANYLRLHTADGEYVTRMKIGDIEGQLDPRVFARVHRSAIASLRHIVAYRRLANRAYLLTLDDGTEIRMSSRYREQVLSSLFL